MSGRGDENVTASSRNQDPGQFEMSPVERTSPSASHGRGSISQDNSHTQSSSLSPSYLYGRPLPASQWEEPSPPQVNEPSPVQVPLAASPVHTKVGPRKNKPKPSRLRQQKLKSWEPTLTANTVIPTIFIISFIFIPIGIFLVIASNSVQEAYVEYQDQCPVGPCQARLNVSQDFKGDVYFYYGLRNFYQNHRRYLKSRNDKQLLGDLKSISECDPYHQVNTSSGPRVIAPCGAIANSMFNDSFVLQDSNGNQVPWTYEGIVWDVDKDKKFKNPTIPAGGDLCSAFKDVEKPINWKIRPCELDLNDPNNNGFENVDFIVWMRTAALPHFRKPYRKLRREGNYVNGLPAGQYQIIIQNNFPVTTFNGRKYFIISTTSWAGGENSFLGVAYLLVGGICLGLGLIFLFIHFFFINMVRLISKQLKLI